MRSLGLDVGDKRTGVAISDPQGILALPLTVINRGDEDATIMDIIKLVEQHEIERIVIGLPRCLNGALGRQAKKVTAFAERLRKVIAMEAQQSHFARVDIRMWDERLSTRAAERSMMDAGGGRNKPRSRAKKSAQTCRLSAKAAVDAVAAALILQGFLDSPRV
jgi:putative Holliday junction resolvase